MSKRKLSAAMATLAILSGILAGCSGKPASSAAPAASASPAASGASSVAQPDGYPKKAVELYVPGSAGGGSDIFARMLSKVASDQKLFPQQIMIVNKPGGNGSVCYGYVANQPADGYVMATVSSSFFLGPATKQSPVSPDDFRTVASMAFDPSLVVVGYDSKFHDLGELIAYAKENPGKVTCAGSSGYSDDRILFEAIARKAGVQMNYVPFESGSEAATAVIGKHADFGFTSPGEGLSQIQGKIMRAIAVSSDERLDAMPDVATLKEQDVDFSLSQFRAVVVPKNTPEPVVAYLSDVLSKIAASNSWQQDYLKTNMVQGSFLGYQEADAQLQKVYKTYQEMLAQIKI